jgi:hypothetical protein
MVAETQQTGLRGLVSGLATVTAQMSHLTRLVQDSMRKGSDSQVPAKTAFGKLNEVNSL